MRNMTGRSKTIGDEGLRFFRRLHEIGVDLGARVTGSAVTSFTGIGPPLPLLMAGNPEVAQQLYRGVFAFAGCRIECQPSEVFELAPPNAEWSDQLHGFTWLVHLEAPGLALYRAFARSLLQSWAAQTRRTSFESSCRRLKSMSRHAGFLLAGASAAFEALYLNLVTREARCLVRSRPRAAADLLHQSVAVLTAALAFRGSESLCHDALNRTANVIASIILPDGGHLDRSPKSLLDLLSDLVPLRTALDAQRVAIPRELNAAIERAIPMLRMLCHGDDGLAVFHGVENTSVPLVRAIFERDMVLGRPLSHAAHTGYCRMNQGRAMVIIDCGAPSVCDSGLAFEFSDGLQRIVGSCGVPANASPAWRAAAQTPAAHSTVHFEDHDNRPIQSFFARRGKRFPHNPVAVEFVAAPHGSLVKASSSAHANSIGLTHHRELFLAAGGHDLRGEDRFDNIHREECGRQFTIRFHLHPSVKASADRRGAAIILLLPSKVAWQFSARGGIMTLEESIYLAASSGPRRSQQIVIRGLAGKPVRVNWAFRKLDRQIRHSAAKETTPQLPF